eukprot:4546572-Amphidinium_carterae.1
MSVQAGHILGHRVEGNTAYSQGFGFMLLRTSAHPICKQTARKTCQNGNVTSRTIQANVFDSNAISHSDP